MAGEDAAQLAPQKAERLSEVVEKTRQPLEHLIEQADHHEHRIKYWDFIANRRRRLKHASTQVFGRSEGRLSPRPAPSRQPRRCLHCGAPTARSRWRVSIPDQE